ncbi:MAG: SPOR domain-containing protein [Prevotellaceae bacterium]|jgi:cell division protein FtsN|nr:SPOR domain-containing protein [Prevotellaceae bacterium]
MKKIVYSLILLFSVFAIGACSSSKNTTKITGANKTAGSAQTSTPQPPRAIQQPVEQPQENTPALQEEITRSESFTLAEGENPQSDAYRKHYHVVVGSFKSRDNAKGLQASLNSEGNGATVVVNENGMYRVILASFNEYLQARACINNVAGRFPDAWVLVNSN